MTNGISKISQEIIDYQKATAWPDTQLAFNLHLSVERLHDIKSMEKQPTNEETELIENFINKN
ncbi:LBP_cg2779 family protein [Nicoliella lavandulae]|uniref:LBP_cg2779 family protein n=1 Tax=Nicoliella lavandulae TaxID=3082954 RepID=A0ABU8SIJ0_9LACO